MLPNPQLRPSKHSEKTNQLNACYTFMCTALERPMALECESAAQAKAWRKTCYTIRQILDMTGDRRFKGLTFEINDKTLNAENVG